MSRGRWAFGLASGAVLWAGGVFGLAFWWPFGGGSLLAENGYGAGPVAAVSLPLALSAVAWLGMHRTCSGVGTLGRRAAGAAILLLGALTLLTGFSIGPALVPCLALLVVGMSLTPAAVN